MNACCLLFSVVTTFSLEMWWFCRFSLVKWNCVVLSKYTRVLSSHHVVEMYETFVPLQHNEFSKIVMFSFFLSQGEFYVHFAVDTLQYFVYAD